MSHQPEEINAYGLTEGQFNRVVVLQSLLGGSALAFDTAYMFVTDCIEMTDRTTVERITTKIRGKSRKVNEKQLAEEYKFGKDAHLVKQGEYVRQRYGIE